jgi:hypothetical protein
MMLYAKHNSKKTNSNNRISLDAKHTEMTKYFKDLHKLLPEKKELLINLKNEYNELLKIKKCNYNDMQLNRFFDLKDLILDLENKINSIDSNQEENNYYLNTSNILYKYYDNINNIANNTPTKKKKLKKPPVNIINFINKKNNSDETNISSEILNTNYTIYHDKHTDKDIINDVEGMYGIIEEGMSGIMDDEIESEDVMQSSRKENRKINRIGDYIDETYSFKRTDLLDEYLQIVDDNYVPNINFDNTVYYCPLCNIEKTIIQSEAIMVCKSCGLTDYIIIDSSKPSYRDPPLEVSYFAYKRINHFNEWISQFQAKESTEIPEHVYEALLSEIKKERITNMNQLTKVKVRGYLKKLKLNKFYEHIPHIINRLNGKSPPRISKEVEEKLRIMFKEIQGPFMEICPPVRKNFLSYSYVLHKFVELLGLDEYKECFTLLKSREKLHVQDIMWRQITKKVGWEFYKSI